MREVEFTLLYYVAGMTPARVAEMDQDEAIWWVKRIGEQREWEIKNNPFRGLK